MPDVFEQLIDDLEREPSMSGAFLRSKRDANALFRQGARVMQVFHMQGVTPSVQDDILQEELETYFTLKREIVGVKVC